MPPTHGGDAYGIQHRICLLDAIVLAAVSREKEGTYGYRITQQVREAIDISESTLYPVLRRLQKDDCLESTTGRLTAETAGITGSQNRDGCSCSSTKENGQSTPRRFPTS